MGQLQHPVLGTLEVPDRLLQPENREELEQNLLQLAADTLPQDEAWYQTFTKQFGRTASETARGAADIVGMDKPENDYVNEFVRRARAIQNPKAALAGQLFGAVGDVPSYLFGGFARKGAGFLEDVITRGISIGGVSGGLMPVYEMFGDDRITNAAVGAALGGALGGSAGLVLRKLGYKTEEELADALRKASPEERADIEQQIDEVLQLESPRAFDQRKAQEAEAGRQEQVVDDARVRAEKMTEDAQAEELRLAQEAELARIRQAGDEAGAQIKAEGTTARVADEFEANLAEQRNATLNMQMRQAQEQINAQNRAAYDARVAEIKAVELQNRQAEIDQVMTSKIVRGSMEMPIEDAVAKAKKAVTIATNRLKYIQKQIDAINSGAERVGTKGRGINVLRAERDRLTRDLETEKGFLQNAEQVKAARKENNLLKKKGTSPIVEQRVQQRLQEFPAPENIAPVQVPVQRPVQAAPEAINPMQLQMIPEGMAPTGAPRPPQAAPVPPQQVDAFMGAPNPDRMAPPNVGTSSGRFSQGQVQRMGSGEVLPQAPVSPSQPRSGQPSATPQGTGNVQSGGATEAIRESASSVGEGLDYVFGNMLTTMRNISPTVAERMSRYDFNKGARITKNSKEVEPFARAFKEMSPNLRSSINAHLMSGEFKEAEQLMTARMRADFQKVKKVLTDTDTEAEKAGLVFDKIENYFPRQVKEGQLNNLRKALGREDSNAVNENLKWWADKNNMDVRDIPEDKQAEIINQTIRGIFRGKDAGKVSFQRKRTVKKIDPALEKFYEDPIDSLLGYIEKSSRSIETAKFFGRRKDVSLNSDGEPLIDNKSIGAVVQEAIIKDNLKDRDKIDRLFKLLASRFEGEVNTPNKFFGGVRDIGYIDTIGDVVSAFKQIQDLAQSARKYGIGNTIAAAFNTKNLNAVELGIENAVAHELKNGRATVKLLQKVFEKSGFNFIDRLGKETIANAAHLKHVAMLKSPKGEAKFRKMYKDQLGDSMEQTIKDIRDGKFTDNVQFLAYNNIQDLQPINTTNMPELYAKMKNGRVTYMLKSFTLKQFDVVRREVVQEAMKGNIGEASKNLFMISTFLMAAGVPTSIAVDWVLGREIRMKDLPDRALWSLLGVFGMNAYLWQRYFERGDVAGGAANVIMPPMDTATLPARLVSEAFDEEPTWDQFLKDVPILGTLLYNRLGTGAEKYNERLD